MINAGLSDPAVLRVLGERLKQQRLDRNITQQELADRAGLSRPTVSDIERGRSASLLSWVRILRVLDLLTNLEAFLPAPLPSPLQLARQQGKQRQRASRGPANDSDESGAGDPSW